MADPGTPECARPALPPSVAIPEQNPEKSVYFIAGTGVRRPPAPPGYTGTVSLLNRDEGNMEHEAMLARLRAPFPAEDVEWRLQQAGEKNGKIWGKALAYITNRAIMDRLDAVVGADRWQNVFTEGPGGGILCGISIRLGDEWVTKWDGAENTDVEPVKGGLSNAMKRAAVQWGIGRYLYKLEEGWAVVSDSGKLAGKTREGTWFRWDPPALPDWALPREPEATEEQLTRIGELLEQVDDTRVATGVRKRMSAGLTSSAAEDAIRFLERKATPPAARAA